MVVCVCANAKEKTIQQMINQGKTFEDLQTELDVCCKCCCCKGYLEKMYLEKQNDLEAKS